MNVICIIGAGQLGSRHLQALKTVRNVLEIFVIETDSSNLRNARIKYEEIQNGLVQHKLHFSNQIAIIPKCVDIAIIATTSHSRYECVIKLFEGRNVNYLILEKPLFSKPNHYSDIAQLIKERGAKAWVNCGRREMEFWQNVRDCFYKSKIRAQVIGSQWGLMCNAIHFIDLIAYLTGEANYEMDLSLLEQKLYESKRNGYYELMGTISFKYEDGSILTLTCYPDGNLPSTIFIANSKNSSYIDEQLGCSYWRTNQDDMQLIREDFEIPLQSYQTGRLVEKILLKGECELPTYQESQHLHEQFVIPIIEFVNKYTNYKNKDFPFT